MSTPKPLRRGKKQVKALLRDCKLGIKRSKGDHNRWIDPIRRRSWRAEGYELYEPEPWLDEWFTSGEVDK